MIAPSAIKDFLARPLRDSRKAKRFSEKAIDRKMFKIDPPPAFALPPYHHQKVCFLLGVKHPSYLFFLDMGLGKTMIVLNLLRHWKKAGKMRRGIVLVPNASNVQGWLDEIKIHAPDLSAAGVMGDRSQRMEAISEDVDLLICTYMGWIALTCDHVEVRKRGKKRGEMQPNPRKLRDLCRRYQAMVLDESTAVKNPSSLTFRALRPIAKHCPIRYALTGTPFGRNPGDLWAQFYLIDGGDTLGETTGLFHGAFFRQKLNYWSGFPEWVFDKRRKKELHRVICHNAIRYSEKECLDLPGLVRIRRPVVFTEEAWQYQERLLSELRKARGNYRLMDNTFTRMRQLCSGFLAIRDEKGQRMEIVFKDNPKMDALVEMIRETPEERKVIVFNEFLRSGRMICERLRAEKIKHLRLYGGLGDRQKAEAMTRFREDPEIKVLVSSRTGAFGLNAQIANYIFFFESPVSPIIRKQMEGRIYRIGQTRRCFIGDLFGRNSIEERILGYLAEGKDLFEALVEGRGKGRIWKALQSLGNRARGGGEEGIGRGKIPPGEVKGRKTAVFWRLEGAKGAILGRGRGFRGTPGIRNQSFSTPVFP